VVKKSAQHKIKKVHNKLLKGEIISRSRFSITNLAVFALIIAGIGTYSIFHSSAASIYYLSPSGSGSTCLQASPCSSLAAATDKLQAGDTLVVHGGTYNFREASSWGSANGTASSPITVKAATGETPVFDGGSQVNAGYGEWWVPSGRAYWILDGLTVTHFDNSFGNGAITPSNGSNHLEFRNMTFKDNGSQEDNDHDIYIGGCDSSCLVHDIYIHNNHFINGPGGALHMWHYQEGYNIYFYDNLVQNKLVGAYVCDDADNIHITNNTFVNTSNTGGRGSIVTWCGQQVNGAQHIYIRNNIFYRTAGPCWQREPNPRVRIEDHNIWFCSHSDWTLDSTSKGVDPQMVDPANGDFHLKSGSPAIDAGTASDAPSTGLTPPTSDFEYNARPAGASYDLGAYEFGGAVSPPQPPPTPPPPPPGIDITPPTAPTNLHETTPASCTNDCTMPVAWIASTDNVGVDHYDLFRNGNLVGTDVGSATSTLFGGSLGTCETHTVGLEAVDAAGNRSARTSITATTYCPSAAKVGDLNSDNSVNIFDLSILLSNYNKTKAQSSNAGCDLNNDNIINIFDLSILLSHYGT
jgi:hypothetical protein